MKPRTAAGLLRKIGLDALVDSPRLRRAVGAPLYRRHLESEVAKSSYEVQSAQEESSPHPPGYTADATSPQIATHPPTRNPQLSVIVPVYNVEAYLAETLRSILSQSFEDFEVIAVDDGSTDGSLKILEQVAAKDARVTVITKQNAGLGAARNTGLENASAPFITFVDSDDVITPGAYKKMMNSLANSGSDVAIGGVERFTAKKHWTPAWAREVHLEDKIGITAQDFPPILWDVFAVNKIYKRDTWDREVGKFPEGILYEDQECSGKLYTSGAKLDVLADTVYSWRLREDGTSITQQKNSIRDLKDRTTVIQRMVLLMEDADPKLRKYWYTKALTDDIYWYLVAVPRASLAFWEHLREVVVDLYERCPIESLQGVPLARRLLIFAAALGNRKDFDAVQLYWDEIRTKGMLRFVEGKGLILTAPIVEQLSFPLAEELLKIEPSRLETLGTLRTYDIDDDGDLLISGDFSIEGFDLERFDANLSAVLIRETNEVDEGDRVHLDAELVHSAVARMDSTDALNDSSTCGFSIKIPQSVAEHLPRSTRPNSSNRWLVVLVVTLREGYVFEISLSRKDTRGSAGWLGATKLTSNQRRLAPVTLSGGRLAFEHLQVIDVASDVTVNGDAVSVELQSSIGADRHIVATNADSGIKVYARRVSEAPSPRYEFIFPRRTKLGTKESLFWNIEVVGLGKVPHHLALKETPDTGASQRFVADVTGYGYLRLREQIQSGVVTHIHANPDDGQIAISGEYYFDPQIRLQTPSFALVSSTRIVQPERIVCESGSGSFEAVFNTLDHDADGRETRIESGLYIFQLLSATKQALPASVWLPCASRVSQSFPMDIRGKYQRILCTRTPASGALGLNVRPPLQVEESGQYQQQQLIEKYRTVASSSGHPKLRDAVLFESFAGKSVQDSPLSIDTVIAERFPNLHRFWTVWDFTNAVPDGATPVVAHSREWYEALATSKYLVNNNNFPHWFRKRPGQTYVQTWHGTPLKKIGNDVPKEFLSQSYRALMKREAESEWDYLLAQSPWAAERLRSAFGFPGEVLSLGYPRNDALARFDDAKVRRAIVRRHLGISVGQRVVMYAPTWRDNVRDDKGRYKYNLFMDVDLVSRKLDHDVVFLLRGHHNTAHGRTRVTDPRVREVSAYPNINDLMLAADVLVTDYSSSMFDFVVTGKPIVFFAPDLVEYRDSTRGFYFDFERLAPGPICKNNSELASELSQVLEEKISRASSYLLFREMFAPADDGFAASRVVDEIWSEE